VGRAAFLVLWQGFPANAVVQAILAAVAVYGVGLTLLRSRRG